MSDRVCPYCDVQLGPRAVDLRPNQFVESFIPRANKSAIIVVTMNLLFFLVQQMSSGFTNAGIEFGPYIFAGQWWRLITAGFLHGGFLHVAMNSWSLWILVTETEHFYGTSRLAVAYVVSTITGFALAALTSPAPVLGASCAAFGLMGAMLAIGLRDRADPISQAVRSHYGTWLVYGAIMSFVIPGISWQGHLGGFLGGLAVGFIAGLPTLPGSPKEVFWKYTGIASVALVALAWFEALTHRTLF